MGHSQDRQPSAPPPTTSRPRPSPGVGDGATPVVRGQRVETDASRMRAAGDRLAAVLAGREQAPAFRFEPQVEE